MKKRKLFDEKGRLFGIVSVIDLMAVAVVVVLGVMLYARFFSGGEADISDPGTKQLTFTVKLSPVRSYTADAIEIGDQVFFEDSDAVGEVVGKEIVPAMTLTSTLDGRVVEMENENYCGVLVTVRASGTVAGRRSYAGGSFELLNNAEFTFLTKYVTATGKIISVEQGV